MRSEKMCILCKKKSAVGDKNNLLFCRDCQKRDILIRMAAFQRHETIRKNISKYENECWNKEKVLKTQKEVLKNIREKCNSFNPGYMGYKEIAEEIKNISRNIPTLIKAKINLRKNKKKQLKEIRHQLKKQNHEDTRKKIRKEEKDCMNELKRLKIKK